MISCPVCQSPSLPTSENLFTCARCDHLFQYPPVITCSYDRNYLRTYETYPTSTMSHLRLGFLKAFVGGGRLLDIGYGTGDFVKLASSAGFDAFGSDRHGVDFGIREVSLADDRSEWDVVTLFDSLEHFDDLTVLRQLFDRARFVLISTPFRPETFPMHKSWRHYKPGEHLHYFSPTSLQRFVGKNMIVESNVEDVVRKGQNGSQNIYTAFFSLAGK